MKSTWWPPVAFAAEPDERPRVKAWCLRLLVTLKLDPARSRFISGFIDTYLRLNRDELLIFNDVLATEQEKIMELTTSWKEEGLHKGEAIALKRLLNRRFKVLPAGSAGPHRTGRPRAIGTMDREHRGRGNVGGRVQTELNNDLSNGSSYLTLPSITLFKENVIPDGLSVSSAKSGSALGGLTCDIVPHIGLCAKRFAIMLNEKNPEKALSRKL